MISEHRATAARVSAGVIREFVRKVDALIDADVEASVYDGDETLPPICVVTVKMMPQRIRAHLVHMLAVAAVHKAFAGEGLPMPVISVVLT